MISQGTQQKVQELIGIGPFYMHDSEMIVKLLIEILEEIRALRPKP